MKKLHYALLVTTLIIGQSAHAVDLLTLHEETLSSSPSIASSAADVEMSRARARQSLGDLLPQVSLTAKGTITHYETATTEEDYNGKRYQLSLTQELFNKAKYNDKKASDKRVEEAEEYYLALVATVSVDLLDRYTAVLAAEDVLEQITSEKKLTVSELESQKSKYERQLALLTDVLDLEARFDRLVAEEIAAENAVAVARASLGELVGYDVTTSLSGFRETFDYAPLEGLDKDYWVSQGLRFNHQLKGLRSKIQASEESIKSATAAHLPTLYLQLTSSRSNIGYENALTSEYESNVASINLNVPLYSGGKTNARVNQMEADFNRNSAAYEEKRRQISKNIQEAYLNVSANVVSIKASAKAIESAKKSFDAMEKGYKYGTATVIEVLDARREVLKQQIEYRKKQYDYAVNYLNLLSLTGQFNNESINQVNSWLEK
ncbi:TolC family outer membrane protein [Marinomonas sp. 2405UD66-6]|uniref:TolC family outer membrane protein n=1 Tax=Marinomonas sp. 2405UD66-6 TaxID=3391834 RepID=UPI0039C9DA79